MIALLKEIAQRGYLEEWPGSGEDLVSLLRGVNRLQKGAIWAGLAELQKVGRWHALATHLLAEYVTQETLLNAAAELYHNNFQRDKRLLLVLGSVLGPAALTAVDYFTQAARFITRVVGLRYGSRLAEAAALAPGMPVYLVREPENPHDSRAIAVLTPWGAHLGYLRAPLAAVLSTRIDSGETFAARIAAICGEAADADERLHIEVWRDNSPEKICFVFCEPAPAQVEEGSTRH